MIRFESYNASQLLELLNSAKFEKLVDIPISRLRAISQIGNPRRLEDDKLLFVAYQDEQMIGYLGVLPDSIYPTEEPLHVGWLSCFWVHTNHRSIGVGSRLLKLAFESYSEKILAADFTPEVSSLYQQIGLFDPLHRAEGVRCFMHSCLRELLPKRNPAWYRYRFLLRLTDRLVNLLWAPFLFYHKKSIHQAACMFEEESGRGWKLLNELPDSLETFITMDLSNSLERRTLRELRWIVQQPWIQEGPETEESKKYFFSLRANRFKTECWAFYNNNRLEGLLILSIRDRQMKVPYAYFLPGHQRELLSIIEERLFHYQVDNLVCFHPALLRMINDSVGPFFYLHKTERRYLISKKLNQQMEHPFFVFQDGDADCAFT